MVSYEKEKISLITEIFKQYLLDNPNRPERWYGERFDKLYDMSNDMLRHLISIRRPPGSRRAILQNEKD